MTDELETAVAGLYRAFTDVPRPARVTGCTNCCISEEELERLVAVPREQLTADELKSYAFNAPDTVGGASDFRYFLPRLLDLVARGELRQLGDTWVVRRICYVPWTTWSTEQVQAIRAYLMVWWLEVLTETEGLLDEHLQTLGEVETPVGLERYLDVWLTAGPGALGHLATFIHEHITELALGKHWERAAAATLYRWLRSGPPAHALMQSYDDNPDAPDALLLLEAATLVTP